MTNKDNKEIARELFKLAGNKIGDFIAYTVLAVGIIVIGMLSITALSYLF